MHYKNGREAKNGDKVVLIPSYGSPVIGILYDATAGNDACNGQLALIGSSDRCPNLQECLHLDDVLAAVTDKLASEAKAKEAVQAQESASAQEAAPAAEAPKESTDV